MHEYMPVIVTVMLMAALIAVLKMFFTLWGPIDRWINGHKKFMDDSVFLAELKDSTVNIHLRSTAVIESVVLKGYFGRYKGTPEELRQVVVAMRPDGVKLYVRFEAIDYFERITRNTQQPSPSDVATRAAPEK